MLKDVFSLFSEIWASWVFHCLQDPLANTFSNTKWSLNTEPQSGQGIGPWRKRQLEVSGREISGHWVAFVGNKNEGLKDRTYPASSCPSCTHTTDDLLLSPLPLLDQPTWSRDGCICFFVFLHWLDTGPGSKLSAIRDREWMRIRSLETTPVPPHPTNNSTNKAIQNSENGTLF